MNAITISPKFDIVIPKNVRKRLNLTPGRKLAVFVRDKGILFVPVRPIEELEGFVPGIDTNVEREDDRVTCSPKSVPV